MEQPVQHLPEDFQTLESMTKPVDMSIEDLIKPRYKVIALWPFELESSLGEIYSEPKYHRGGQWTEIWRWWDEMAKHPHLFKKLEPNETGNEPEEVWKPIIGHEHYEISNLGAVRKTSYLRINYNKGGYSQVQLFKTDGCGQKILGRGKQIGKKGLLHRLIAEAFIPNPDNLPCINHKDGNKANNSIDNLEWCTHSENNKHAYDTGLKKQPKCKRK